MRRLLSLTVAILAAPLASSAQQIPVCGATITESITLTEDLYCSGPALTVRVPNHITIDLGGHTVSSTFPAGGKQATIQVLSGKNVLRNGRVVRTETDALNIVSWGGGNVYEDLTIDGGRSIFISSSGDSIRRSNFINGAYLRCGDVGLGVSDSTFTGPSPSGNAIQGFLCALSATHNTFSGYQNAISSEYTWGSNVTDNLIEGGGIYLAHTGGPPEGLGTTKITGNTIRSPSGHGIFLTDLRDGFAMSNNIVIGGAGDGIRTDNNRGANATVLGNLAIGNAGLGINTPNVVDGGGNRAGGNGDPLQCVGVVCGLADLMSELEMCVVERAECEDALGSCNSTVIGTNGDFNGDGQANVVDSAIFRRWIAGYPVP